MATQGNTVTIHDTVFLSNQAAVYGGAIFVTYGKVNVSASQFTGYALAHVLPTATKDLLRHTLRINAVFTGGSGWGS